MRGLRLLLLSLLVPGAAGAGERQPPRHERGRDCPPSQYSRLNYLAPSLWSYHAHHRPAAPYLYPPAECVTPQPVILTYPCRAADPATFPYGDLRGLR